jgi:eukaryotic-like serine/threonine-protein kinase
MSPERWQQIQGVFDKARSCGPNERRAVLDEACASDKELRAEVEWMLTHQGEAENLMPAPALELAALSVAAETGTLLVGSSLGPYEDLQLIGRGGMGEVYRARDPKLMREVALKVLPRAFASDPGRVSRFQREAHMLAALNHPNISVIHDLHEDRGLRFIVLEYVLGETLNTRLKRGPLAIDESLTLLKQVAEALEAAHERGIFHRDLKPSNIQITPEGRVKVLDFGLAKMNEPDGKFDAVQSSGNIVFGTASYMSPEQASGGPLDRQTDIWSFGCVLYETLTAQRAFVGENAADIIAAIKMSEPDYELLPASTPIAVRSLLRRCLQKSPKDRLHDISDVRIGIEDALIALPGMQPPARSHVGTSQFVAHNRSRKRWAWALLVLAGLLVSALAGRATLSFRNSKQEQLIKFLIDPPFMPNEFQITVSPDGRMVAFVAGPANAPLLYVRPIDSTTAQPLSGTEGAFNPFWSPDSRYIGFAAPPGKLRKIEATGGTPQTLCGVGAPFFGGTWNSDGVILFSSYNVLYRVSAAGGVPIQVTALDKSLQEVSHSFPYFLPDGRHYLYLTWSSQPQNRAIFVDSLDSKSFDSKERKLLTPSDGMAMYANPGHLLYLRAGTLLAQSLDTARLELVGEPVRLAEDIATWASNGRAAVAVSSSLEKNVLVYRSRLDVDTTKARIALVDRSGKVIDMIGAPSGYQIGDLAPDGKRLAVHIHQGIGGDVWIMEIPGGNLSRLTFDPSQDNGNPIWSPDGQKIVFHSRRNGKWGIYMKPSNGTGSEELLVESLDHTQSPMSWSADGNFILYSTPAGLSDSDTSDVWALPLKGERKAFPLLNTRFLESWAQISPDGKWFAYTSGETGPIQIYVQSFPPGRGKWQISRNGGIYPRWRADGKELFFMETPDFGKVMAAEIHASGSTLESSVPHPLFDSGYYGTMRGHTPFSHTFAVSRDGQRFLIPRAEADHIAPLLNPPITVVVNWTAALKN